MIFYSIYCVFDQINAALVSRRDFFQRDEYKKIVQIPEYLNAKGILVFWQYDSGLSFSFEV